MKKFILTMNGKERTRLSRTLATCLATGAIALGPGGIATAEQPPVAYERLKLLASDLDEKDRFGDALALDDDTLLVGAKDKHGCKHGCSLGGRAYLFERQNGEWNEIARLTGSDPGSEDLFGIAVALAGDLAFVGASEASQGHLRSDALTGGKVYVFENSVEVARLVPSNGNADDEFGCGLAVAGQTLLVAAKKAEYPGRGVVSSGRVYVFEQGPGGADDWTEVDQLSLPFLPEERFELFGSVIAADGDTLLVTSTGTNVPHAVDQVVWALERDSEGIWQHVGLLRSLDQEIDAGFGDALAVDGDRAIIGASSADSFFPDTGAAYVFERDAAGEWRQIAKLQEEIETISEYGLSVGIDGDVAVVGSRGAVDGRGAAFVYHRNAGGPDRWGLVSVLLASDGEGGDSLGNSVAIDGLTVAAGADDDDDACGPGGGEFCDSGAVYIFGEL